MALAQPHGTLGDRQKLLHTFFPLPHKRGRCELSLVAAARAHFVLFAGPLHVFTEREVSVTLCLERGKKRDVWFLDLFQIWSRVSMGVLEYSHFNPSGQIMAAASSATRRPTNPIFGHFSATNNYHV